MLFKIENNKEVIQEQSNGLIIKHALKPKLDFIKEMVDSRPKSCPEVYWLEINASLMFIKKEAPTMSKQSIVDTLLKRKPFLNEYKEDIYYSINMLLNAA
jgi:hypothetical protein